MLKMSINNEEVVSNNNFTIKEEMLSASSTVLNNCYPKTWEQDHDYNTRFYYPKDYSKMVLTNNTYYPPITGSTIEGTNFQINVDKTLEEDYSLNGDTTQEQTPGKNLIPMSTFDTMSNNGSGFTYTSSNHRITFNNENNGGKGVYKSRYYTFTAGTTYYLSFDIRGTANRKVQIGWNNKRITHTLTANYTRVSIDYAPQTDNEPIIFYTLSKANGGLSTNEYMEFDNVMISTSSDTTYEQYTYGPTPNPNYPQEVQVVTGYQSTYINGGKNLFDKWTKGYSINATQGQRSINTKGAVSNFIPVNFNENSRYYVSGVDNTLWLFVAAYNSQFQYLGRTGASGYSALLLRSNSFTSGTPQGTGDIAYIRITAYENVSASGTIDNIDNWKTQVEANNTATTYEPFKGSIKEYNLGKNLWRSINFTISVGHINWVTSEDGSIKGNGTASGASYSMSSVQAASNNALITLEPGVYCLSGGISSTKMLQVVKSNGTGIGNDNGGGLTFKITEPTDVFIRTYVPNGTIVDDVFYPQLEKNTVTDYSPYFTPIELCKIGNYKDRIFKGKGINLFDRANAVENKIFTWAGGAESTVSGSLGSDYIEVNVGDEYIQNYSSQVMFYDKNKEYLGCLQSGGTTIAKAVGTYFSSFTIPNVNDIYYMRLGYRASYGGNPASLIDKLIMLNKGTTLLPYEPYNAKNKWYIEKNIGKKIFTGTNESWNKDVNRNDDVDYFYIANQGINTSNIDYVYTNYFKRGDGTTQGYWATTVFCITINKIYTGVVSTDTKEERIAKFKTWLGTHNLVVYYALQTPTYTEIANEELINQLNNIKLINGINNITIGSTNLAAIMNLHYNFQTERTEVDLIFSGIVKNTSNISLNPREPKYCSLEILDYKTLLSEGTTLDFVISNKTILEAIEMVVDSISSYGFEVGNINILNGDEVIGAYSTENKTAYDVLQYLADISGAKWTCRRKDDNSMYIDFYDPTLMPRGKQIEYTSEWACENNLMDIKFNYGTRDYRNKQIIISDEVVGDIDYIENLVGDNVNKSFLLSSNIASITSIVVNGENKTVATESDKDIGIYADFYYKPGSNEITSNNTIPSGTIIKVSYKPIIKGREVITNDNEIARLNNQLEVNGTIARYETRNDETDSNKLLAIGETYLRYKGEAEINLTITTKDNNLYDVGQMVYFNAPIPELAKDYLVKSKQINIIANGDDPVNVFYTFILSSSFNAEREVNWFDNQRNKQAGNIAEGDFISRNIDISSTANIIWDNLTITELTGIVGNNELNATLNTPLNE